MYGDETVFQQIARLVHELQDQHSMTNFLLGMLLLFTVITAVYADRCQRTARRIEALLRDIANRPK